MNSKQVERTDVMCDHLDQFFTQKKSLAAQCVPCLACPPNSGKLLCSPPLIFTGVRWHPATCGTSHSEGWWLH